MPPPHIETIQNGLKGFIQKLTNVPEIAIDTPLLESRVIDSLNVIHLLLFIESEYNVKFGSFDIRMDDLRTIERLSEVILNRSRQ